jgi:hypothetical protein
MKRSVIGGLDGTDFGRERASNLSALPAARCVWRPARTFILLGTVQSVGRKVQLR